MLCRQSYELSHFRVSTRVLTTLPEARAFAYSYPRFVASEDKGSMTLEGAGLHPQATLFVRELLDD